MIATDLVIAVADEIRAAVKYLKLPIEHHAGDDNKSLNEFLNPVTVYEGFLPREDFNNDAYYPLVLVEWLGTNDDFAAPFRSTSNIGLSMGVFAAERHGWKDLLHLTETIRTRLLRNRVVGKKFRLIDSATWEVAPDQPLPFMYTYATLTYQTFQPDSWL